MTLNALTLLEKLISCESISPKQDGALDYLALQLEELGFNTQYVELGEGDAKTANLYARYGTAKPHLCFAGHVDVVPPGDMSQWKHNPFEMHISDDIITGRGTCDMKGSLAAMLEATSKYLTTPFEGSISFLLTSDEEGDATFGTQAILEHLGKEFDADFCLIGEPTSIKSLGDTVKIGRRGSVNFKLEIFGTQGHSAYPHLADNPIQHFAPILSEFNSLTLDEGNEFFDASNLEITSIDVGNATTNVIPGQISCNFNIRFNNIHSASSLDNMLRKIISKHSSNFELNWQCSSEAFLSGRNSYSDKLCNAIQESLEVTPQYQTNGGTSDARFIRNYCPVAEFGFLSDQAHKVNEHIKISDLQKLRDVYYLFLEKFFQ